MKKPTKRCPRCHQTMRPRNGDGYYCTDCKEVHLGELTVKPEHSKSPLTLRREGVLQNMPLEDKKNIVFLLRKKARIMMNKAKGMLSLASRAENQITGFKEVKYSDQELIDMCYGDD